MSFRRRLLLPLLFLGPAVVLSGTSPARGQPPRPLLSGPRPTLPVPRPTHPVAQETVSPEQVKEFLKRLNGGVLPPDLDPYADLLERLRRDNPKLVEDIRERYRTDPAFREWAAKQAEQFKKDPSGRPAVDELRKYLPNLPKTDRPGVAPGPDTARPPEPKPPQTLPPIPDLKLPHPDGPPPPPLTLPPDDLPNTPPLSQEDFAKQLARAFDPLADPFPGRGLSPEELLREKRLETAAALWERNIGPLDETPAVKQALFDLVEGTNLTGANGSNLWDALGKDGGDSGSFADWLNGTASDGGDWKLPKMDFGSTSFGRWWSGSGNVNFGRSSSSSGRWSGGDRSARWGGGPSAAGTFGFGEGSWLPVILLAAVILGGLIWWRFWYLRDPLRAADDIAVRLGPWPVDPRAIATRDDLVRAFEYLSVLICGPAARTWTHGTIAQALADLAATYTETARLLARLYELARYAPLDEPLTPADLAEGRRLVCQLAGVPGV